MRLRSAILLASLGLLVALAGACGGETSTPTSGATSGPLSPTATGAPPTETAVPTLVGDALEGSRLFMSKGCGACHGQDAQGTSVGPPLGGHSASAITRQVRAPIGLMPVFPVDKLSDAELGMIVAFLEALPGHHLHEEPGDLGQEVALHHWMALLALEAGDVAEAVHHVEHIIELVEGDHLARMQHVLQELEEGHTHDAAHTIEDMVAGTVFPELVELRMHLLLSAVRVDDGVNAVHHLDHFLELASPEDLSKGRGVLAHLQGGEFHEAEHELEELLGQPELGKEEGHAEEPADEGHDEESEEHEHDEGGGT